VANDFFERQLTGEIYVNDLHGVNSPYSYYEKTVIVIKRNDEIIYTTMKELFNEYEEFIEELPDREVIKLNNIEILDGNKFVKLKLILRHKIHNSLIKLETKNGYCTIVTEDHPVITDNGEKLAKDLTLNDTLKISDNIELKETRKIDDKLAYIIGYVIGDGWIHPEYNIHHKIIGGEIEIRQNNIESTKIFKYLNDIYPNVRVCREDRSGVRFGYKKDVLEYINMGIGFGSKNKKLPIDILTWNISAIKSLIAGLIDAEANINPNGSVCVRMISFECIQQLGELLRITNAGKLRTSFAGVFNSEKGFKSNNQIYRMTIRLDDREYINLSEKIRDNIDVVYKSVKKDGRFETNKLHCIEVFEEDVEFVYDVTTETGTFQSQGLKQHNCFNFSTYDIMTQGLPFVTKIESKPPKHLSSFIGQLIHFTVYASNSTLGAVGLADMLIVASYYVNKMFVDNPTVPKAYLWSQIKQELQSFIFSCNQPFRGGIQSGFYNISIYDDIFLAKMCEEYVFPDGEKPDKELIKKLQIMYIDLMNETLSSTSVTFPITTACFAIDDNKNILDTKFLKLIAEKNQEWGFIYVYAGKTSTLSSCCRLRSDTENEYFNQFGAGGTKIGSLGVVTLNIPRLAIRANGNRDKFFELLRNRAELAIRINNVKRHILTKRIEDGRAPLYDYGFMLINKQYSTTGAIGFNEACKFMGMDILEEEGQTFVTDIINQINALNDVASKKYGAPHNCEQVPAENSAIKIAKKDKLLGYQDSIDLYSNQFIPLTVNADLLDRIKIQGLFDSKMSGGAVVHLNVETRISQPKLIEDLINTAVKCGVVYHAINYNLQRCSNGHMSVGLGEKCSICGADITDNFTRVVGFLTNIKNWHKVRREDDYPNREFYKGIGKEVQQLI